LIDKPGKPLKSGLAAIAAVHTGDFRLTPIKISLSPASASATEHRLTHWRSAIPD
jgi:hypothetical protein